MSDVNLATLQSDGPHWTADSSLAEITSLTLEFGALARASGTSLLLRHPSCDQDYKRDLLPSRSSGDLW